MTLQNYIDSIKSKKIAALGIGVSNVPLIELLAAKGCDVTACDKRSLEQLGGTGRRLLDMGVKLRLGVDYLYNLHEDIIFRTPGLMPFEAPLVRAKEKGSLLTSEMEVFFSLCPCKIIAITGSDGKTTTSTIISELLKAAGYKVHLGGNIGHPLLCEVDEIKEDHIVVLELSSFQLHSMYCKPDIALITNVSPNHLDKHLDYQDYIDSKSSIFINQTADCKLILKLDDEHTEYYESLAHSEISHFSNAAYPGKGVVCENGAIYRINKGVKSFIMNTEEIKLPGEHNVLNYMAAFEATSGLVSDDICKAVAMSFGGVQHRLEHVRELRGVEYINDSIASSPTRTIAGLHALKTKPIVIAGGYDKQIPFDKLGDEFCLNAKKLFLTGATAEAIKAAVVSSEHYKDSGIEIKCIDDFAQAVHSASAAAESGDIVILSPACASFDKFANFEERGLYFKKLVMELE